MDAIVKFVTDIQIEHSENKVNVAAFLGSYDAIDLEMLRRTLTRIKIPNVAYNIGIL